MTLCAGCGKTPGEIRPIVAAAHDQDLDPLAYVLAEDETYNLLLDTFLCPDCWIELGMPTTPIDYAAVSQSLMDRAMADPNEREHDEHEGEGRAPDDRA